MEYGKRRNKVNKHASIVLLPELQKLQPHFFSLRGLSDLCPAASVPPIGPLRWRLPLPGMLRTAPTPPHPRLLQSSGTQRAPLLLSHAITPSPLPSSLGAPVLCSSKPVSTLETHFLSLKKEFITFWLPLVFVAALGLSLVAGRKGYSLVAVRGLLIAAASLVVMQGL